MRRSMVAGPLALGILCSTLSVALTAAAPSTGCGMVITQSMTLTGDIGPCGRGGIVIAADGVRVDLAGHSIIGKSGAGDGAGILFDGVSAAWVLNGTVRGFDAGVAIVGGNTNTVWGMTIKDNIGNLKGVRPAYGDGVAIVSSSLNWVTRSAIVNNGPFGGISILADAPSSAENNVIDRNRIVDNDVARASINEDSGIRVEGPNVTGTTIMDNTILANGLDGIALIAAAGPHPSFTAYVTRNVVQGNGFHAMGNRKGDGIVLLGGSGAIVAENEVSGNAAHGIRVSAVDSRILGNDAISNGAYPGTSVFDLADENADCDGNEWVSNVFGSANRACIA